MWWLKLAINLGQLGTQLFLQLIVFCFINKIEVAWVVPFCGAIHR